MTTNIKYIACSQCGTFPDEATAIRFRRVCKILDLQKFVPDDDMELYRCMFPVLGIMARTLEKQKAATTEANKRFAELESEVAELKESELEALRNSRFYCQKALELKASNNHLREVLENVLSWVVYQPVACHGMKCRESVCESCFGEEAAEIASKQAGEAVTIARKTLSATPAESLQAHDDEVLEYKVDAERYRFMKRHDMTDVYSDLISYRLNPFEFNPIDLDSVIDEALKEVK
jgi:flagellar basal body-associated protein FliL